MPVKLKLTWIITITSSIFALSITSVRAYTFSSSQVTPAQTLDFTTYGYRYDTMANSGITGGNLQVRENAANLSGDEISRFLNALDVLKTERFVTTANGQTISEYDQFVATHLATMDMTGRIGPNGQPLVNGAHGNAAFLPWHRQFLNEFELALQSVDASVTIPYWDWTNQAATQNIIFQDNFMGPNGNAAQNRNITSGLFTVANGWGQRTDLSGNAWTGINTNIRAIRRNLGAFTALGTQAQVNNALNTNAYLTLRGRLEAGAGMHNAMHNWFGTGSTMRTQTSPNDPMFWLVHANVDRLWGQWQLNGRWGSNFYPAAGQPYGHNLNDAMWPWNTANIPIANDLLDLTPNLPGQERLAFDASQQFMMASAPTDLFTDTSGGYMYNPWGHHAYHGDQPCPDIVADLPCDKPCHNGSSVPEPASLFGLLAFGALGAGSLKKGSRKVLAGAKN
jgi:tyrosinase